MASKLPDPKRVAKLRPLIDAVQKAYWAKNKATDKYRHAEAALVAAVGPGHEHTNESCRVNKIGGCIYPTRYSVGSGNYACILCGHDDFDF